MNVVQAQPKSPPSAIDKPSRATVRWLVAGVAAAAILAFCPILHNGFIQLDDGVLVAENPDLNPPTPSHWGHYWGKSRLYMPLAHMFWGVIAIVAQSPGANGRPATLSPAVFHAVSLLLHSANAVLVFLLLRRLVAGEWAAFWGALLFAVHPLQTEAVAWIAETSILLSTLFSLFAILGFLKFSDSPTGRRAKTYYALATLALALALLSKPAAVVVPALVLVIEMVLPIRRSLRAPLSTQPSISIAPTGVALTAVRRRPFRPLLKELALWAAMSAVIAVLVHRWQTSSFTFPLWQRPVIAADALAFYLYKLVVPIGLLPNYCRTPAWLFAHPSVAAVTWLAPVALLAVAILLWKRARWVMAAVLLFMIALLPVLGLNVFVFQQFSTPADRYAYLGMLGPALAVAAVVSLRPGRLIPVALGLAMALLACLSIRQSTYWVDSLTLFSRVIEAHPDSRMAHEQVALAFNLQSHAARDAREMRTAQRKLELALQHYLIAASLPDDRGLSSFNAADCLIRLRRPQEAKECLEAALRDPRFELRATAWIMMGKYVYEPQKNFASAADCYARAEHDSQGPELAKEHQTAVACLSAVRLRQSLYSAKPAAAPAR